MICLTRENEINCLFEGLISIGVGLEYKSDVPLKSETFWPRVAIAALWLRLLTSNIYKASREEMYKNRTGGETAWNGPPGYSIERWNLWKNRLQELSTTESGDADVKKACRATAGTMEAAEHALATVV